MIDELIGRWTELAFDIKLDFVSENLKVESIKLETLEKFGSTGFWIHLQLVYEYLTNLRICIWREVLLKTDFASRTKLSEMWEARL